MKISLDHSHLLGKGGREGGRERGGVIGRTMNLFFKIKLIHMYCIYSIYRDFYMSLESNIKSDRELLVHIMINLRSHYTSFCSSNDQREVVKASQQGTLIGVIEEVYSV